MSLSVESRAPDRRDRRARSYAPFLQGPMERSRQPAPPMQAVVNPRSNESCIHLRSPGELRYREQIAFEIAPGNTQAGVQVGVRTDPFVQAKGRGDLRPVRADLFANFGQHVGG